MLVVNADSGIGTMAAPLMAYPDIAAVDWHAGAMLPGGTIPAVDFLLTYDVVIVWVNRPLAPDRVVMGDTLADYVDAGGPA